MLPSQFGLVMSLVPSHIPLRLGVRAKKIQLKKETTLTRKTARCILVLISFILISAQVNKYKQVCVRMYGCLFSWIHIHPYHVKRICTGALESIPLQKTKQNIRSEAMSECEF